MYHEYATTVASVISSPTSSAAVGDRPLACTRVTGCSERLIIAAPGLTTIRPSAFALLNNVSALPTIAPLSFTLGNLMPHISLPDGLPGITSAFAFRPDTARPMRQLAEVLLRGPNTLTSGEREMIAAFVSSRNDCRFCHSSHRAAAAHHLEGNYDVVDAVARDHPDRAGVAEAQSAVDSGGQGSTGRPGRYGN